LYFASELHILEYFKKKQAYLKAFERHRPSIFNPVKLNAFSDPGDVHGYDMKSVTDEMITEIYLEFSNQTRKLESDMYLCTRTGELALFALREKLTSGGTGVTLSLDNTFKAASKATVAANRNATHTKLWKGGVLSIINEKNEIVAWVSTYQRSQ
jgi:hypothetical protein